MTRRFRLAVWAAVLALALVLRLPALTAGLPYTNYVDEGYVLCPVVDLLRTGGWDPGAYQYPSLPLYATAGALALYSPVYAAVHGRSLRQDLLASPPWHYDRIEPAEVLVAGRLLTLCAGLGIVLLTGLLARRVMGEAAGLFGGWFAALLAALVPALVIRSGTTTVDPWATFFTLAALLFAERAVRPPRSFRPYRAALLAGVMTGCAATSKYTGALAGLAVAATLLRVEGDWRRRARTVALAALAALATAAATMPALVLRSGQVLAALASHRAGYEATAFGSYWAQAVRRAEWDLPFEHPELGLPFLAATALGWLVAVRDRRYAGPAAAWTLYAVALLALFTSYGVRPFRNLLPLVPLACVLVALLFVRIGELLASRWRPWAGAAAACLVLGLFLPSLARHAASSLRVVDSRVEAVDWLLRHRPPGEPLLVSEEIAVASSELARLQGGVLVRRQPRAVLRLTRRGDVQFVLTGNFRGDNPILRKALTRGETRAPYRRAVAFGGEPGRPHNRRWVAVYQQVPAGTPPARISRFSAAGGIP